MLLLLKEFLRIDYRLGGFILQNKIFLSYLIEVWGDGGGSPMQEVPSNIICGGGVPFGNEILPAVEVEENGVNGGEPKGTFVTSSLSHPTQRFFPRITKISRPGDHF